MGLASDLGYSHTSANPVHRFTRWTAGTRPGGWVFAHSLRHLDDVVVRLTRGRHSAPSLLTGLAVLGTNFGQPSTPAWVLNLEADPQATVTYRGVTREVAARAATPAETEEIFALAGEFYPGYLRYRQRVAGSRRIRAFVLRSPGGARPDGP